MIRKLGSEIYWYDECVEAATELGHNMRWHKKITAADLPRGCSLDTEREYDSLDVFCSRVNSEFVTQTCKFRTNVLVSVLTSSVCPQRLRYH